MLSSFKAGSATIIQFIVLGLLNLVDALDSIISTCKSSGNTCVSNLIPSIIFYVLITIWFGVILALGLGAEQSRSKRLAQLLILAELAVLGVAAANLKLDSTNHNGILSPVTSVVDVILSVWVLVLAWQLLKSGGKRVVRRRRNAKGSDLRDSR